MNLEDFQDRLPNRECGADIIRETFRGMLRTFHFRREEAQVIHTNLL